MECLQSFNIRIVQQAVAASGSGTCRTWGTVGQYFFSCNLAPSLQNSTYNLTGFKSTDIYGVQVSGYVQGDFLNATKCAVVQDWSFVISLNGVAPLVSGTKTATPDGFAIITTGNSLDEFALSKNTNCVMFSNPYQSVQNIKFEALYAQGVGAEFLNQVALNYDLIFTFYYKYEGDGK